MHGADQASPKSARSDVVVLIPTCSDRAADIRIGYTLTSLTMQDCGPLRICVRDEGQVAIFTDRNVRLLWDHLASQGFELHYRRTATRRGVGVARYELISSVAPAEFALFVDDDMLLQPNAIRQLLECAAAHEEAGFFQGSKLQIDPQYRYLNDINQLNGESEQAMPAEPIPIVFGDAAFLLLRRSALSLVDWDLITRYPLSGLPGEDVLLTLMIADKLPAWGVPSAVAYHLAPEEKRWRWETASDVLQLELLRERVRPETLARALPHLSAYIPSIRAEQTSNDDQSSA
jgi:hypothetical protein